MSDFRLFPEDKEASPGDAVIQFLLDEQEKGNARFKAVSDFLTGPIFGRDQGAHKVDQAKLQKTLDAAEANRKQIMQDLFGIDPDRKMTPGEAALGFGVASIKGITGVPGFALKLGSKVLPQRTPIIEGNKNFENPKDVAIDKLLRKEILQKANKANDPVSGFGTAVFPRKGGVKPSEEELFAMALRKQRKPVDDASFARFMAQIEDTQAAKRIQTQVKTAQKELDALLIEEVNPLVPTNLVKQLRTKGLTAKAGFNEGEQTHFVAFKSVKATRDELVEFGIVTTESGPVLAVNFNSPTLKSELRQVFKERFGSQFLDDFVEAGDAPGQLQRMAGETSKDAPLPSNFSFYNVKDFDGGLQLINRMLDLVNEN